MPPSHCVLREHHGSTTRLLRKNNQRHVLPPAATFCNALLQRWLQRSAHSSRSPGAQVADPGFATDVAAGSVESHLAPRCFLALDWLDPHHAARSRLGGQRIARRRELGPATLSVGMASHVRRLGTRIGRGGPAGRTTSSPASGRCDGHASAALPDRSGRPLQGPSPLSPALPIVLPRPREHRIPADFG